MVRSPSPSFKSPPEDPSQLSPRRALALLYRALRLRCPNCGGGPLFRRWVSMLRSCPSCGLILDRGEEDYFLGGYTINFIVAELTIVGVGGLAIFLTWPQVPWTLLTWGLILLMVLTPVVSYPFAKTLWLATDLIFRPLTLGDLEGHGENLPSDEAEERA